MKIQPLTIIVTLLFYPIFLSVSFIVVLLLIFVGMLRRPFLTKRQTQRMVRRSILFYGRIAIRSGFPWVNVSFEDLEPDHPLPCIYICNHRSSSDPFLMGVLSGEFVQVVNVWPFKLPVYGLFARLAGYLNIRQMPIESFLKQGEELLAQEVSIIGFPEGTRSISSKMGTFHSAMFRLALASEVPIVPICISGSEQVPPKGSLWIKPAKVKVRKLPAILYNTYKEMSSFKLKNYIRDIIQEQLLEMEQAD